MGTLNIVEYDRVPFDANGIALPAFSSQATASKTYDTDTTSAEADEPHDDTRFLVVTVLEDHWIEFGATATDQSRLLPAGSATPFERGTANFRTVA